MFNMVEENLNEIVLESDYDSDEFLTPLIDRAGIFTEDNNEITTGESKSNE
jgi:hypothetical protein